MSEIYGITLLGVVEKPLTPGKIAASSSSATCRRRLRPAAPPGGRPDLPARRDRRRAAQRRVRGLLPAQGGTGDRPHQRRRGARALAPSPARHRRARRFDSIGALEASDSGLINELTRIMLSKKAALCCGNWRTPSRRWTATVSVNLSLKSLADVDDRRARHPNWCASSCLDPRHMVLEVTESAADDQHRQSAGEPRPAAHERLRPVD